MFIEIRDHGPGTAGGNCSGSDGAADIDFGIVKESALITWPELRQITDCTFNRWHAGIGDPSLMGWLTVFAYALTCALAFSVRRKLPPHPAGQRFFWSCLVLLLAFLAINKQLDLQSLATASARCTAKVQGWYADRRNFQIMAILSFIAIACFAGLILLWVIRKAFWRNALALAGLTTVLAFVMVRAVGFHHMDALIKREISGLRLNWILELSGIALICANAVYHLLRSRRTRPR